MRFSFTRIFLFLGMTALLAACSKDKENIAAGISCTIDGTNYTFNTNAFAMGLENSGSHSITIFGTTTADANAGVIGLQVASQSGPVVPGRYGVDFDGPNGESDLGTISWGANSSADPYISMPGSTTSPTEVVITSVTESSIQGTFKGEIITLGNPNNPAVSVKTVTNGKFNVPIKY